MRHAPGEAPDGLHLLRLTKLLFETPVSILGLARPLLRAALGVAALSLAKLALHRGDEPGEPSFEDEIARSRLERVDGRLLADRPGDEDDRQVNPPLLDEGEDARGVEARHRVIRDDEVPGLALQRIDHRLARVHPLELGLEAAPPKFAVDEQGVVFGVFDQEHANGPGRPRGVPRVRETRRVALDRARPGVAAIRPPHIGRIAPHPECGLKQTARPR